jgi:hypothetical protein
VVFVLYFDKQALDTVRHRHCTNRLEKYGVKDSQPFSVQFALSPSDLSLVFVPAMH